MKTGSSGRAAVAGSRVDTEENDDASGDRARGFVSAFLKAWAWVSWLRRLGWHHFIFTCIWSDGQIQWQKKFTCLVFEKKGEKRLLHQSYGQGSYLQSWGSARWEYKQQDLGWMFQWIHLLCVHLLSQGELVCVPTLGTPAEPALGFCSHSRWGVPGFHSLAGSHLLWEAHLQSGTFGGTKKASLCKGRVLCWDLVSLQDLQLLFAGNLTSFWMSGVILIIASSLLNVKSLGLSWYFIWKGSAAALTWSSSFSPLLQILVGSGTPRRLLLGHGVAAKHTCYRASRIAHE